MTRDLSNDPHHVQQHHRDLVVVLLQSRYGRRSASRVRLPLSGMRVRPDASQSSGRVASFDVSGAPWTRPELRTHDAPLAGGAATARFTRTEKSAVCQN